MESSYFEGLRAGKRDYNEDKKKGESANFKEHNSREGLSEENYAYTLGYVDGYNDEILKEEEGLK